MGCDLYNDVRGDDDDDDDLAMMTKTQVVLKTCSGARNANSDEASNMRISGQALLQKLCFGRGNGDARRPKWRKAGMPATQTCMARSSDSLQLPG